MAEAACSTSSEAFICPQEPVEAKKVERAKEAEEAEEAEMAEETERAQEAERAEEAKEVERAKKVKRAEEAEGAEEAERAHKVKRAKKVKRAEGAEGAEGAERAKKAEKAEKTEKAEKAGNKTLKQKKPRRPSSSESGGSFSTYFPRVLKHVHSGLSLSQGSVSVLDYFVKDMFDRIATEAGRLARQNRRATITSGDIQTAVRLLLPGEVGRRAVYEASRAIQRSHNQQ